MGVIELCVEVDVAGASALNVANSLLSCGNNIAGNESKVQRFAINLDDDFDDDDYMISNSYVEDSLDEEEDIDDISDTDEEGGSGTAFWESASYYSNINWSHTDEEDICGFDMGSTFNIGQELFVGMEFESKNAVKNALQQKAWKAKQKAIMIEYGDWDESYGQLSSWMKHMQNHCPGSYYQICDDDFVVGNTVSREYHQFYRVFWTFGQCKEAFKYCKPIIQVDDKDGICLISDRHASIKSVVANEALGWQPPHAYHVYCVRHIASNFNHKFKNEKQKQMLKKLGYTPCKHIFDRNFDKFCDLSPAIKTWIGKISKEKWTMAYDRGGRRHGHMTTNLSECVNKVFRGCRNIPITALVKSTYSRCRQYFVDRDRKAQRELQSGQIYYSKVMKEIQKNQEKVCSHIVRIYDIQRTMFEVEEAYDPMSQRGGQKWSVNLNDRYCQCGQFSTYHYPCSHIIAACGVVSINFYQYIDVVYTNDHILRVYSPPWWPLGYEEVIPPSDVSWTLVPDSSFNRMKGRPRSTRLRNEMDWREPSQTRQKSGRCGVQGHNRRNCPLQSNQGSW
ncbi:hypothetical protein GmHk_03G007764 [Glycine max]|nr:hypothetical protein GmHk_03G007764 [Glycine max]